MSSFQSPVQHMSDALSALRNHRIAAQSIWIDLKRVEFEQTYLDPIEQETRQTIQAMKRLAELLSKAMEHAP